MSASLGRTRDTTFLAAVMVALTLAFGASDAFAGNLFVAPSIKGAGTVTGPGLSCTNNNTNENAAAIGCGTIGPFVPPFLGSVSVTLAATPRSTGGWVFSGWSGGGCSGTGTCTMSKAFDLFAPDETRFPQAIFVDNVAPSATSISPVYSTSLDRTVTMLFDATEAPATFECSMDSTTAFSACASGALSARYTLTEGSHTFRVRATDGSGQTGPVSSSVVRIIDTQLVSGPNDFSNIKRPTFTYSSASGLDFRCSIDTALITVPCGPKNLTNNRASFTPPADLPDGVHTFRVQAFDGGDADQVPIVRTWTVDTVAPDTTVASPDLPEGVLTTLLNANFTFASTEPVGATFQCRLDPATFAPCTSPKAFTNLAFGKQKFEVKAVDRAGNVDATPAVRNWEIAAADNDGDGFNQRSDCNDNDASINPGRAEINDNDVDENCDGIKGVTPPPPPPPPADNGGGGGGGGGVAGAGAERIVIGMPFAFSKSTKKFTIFTVLQIRAIPIGSLLKVSCKAPKGKKCPGGASFTKRNAFGTVNLKQWLKKKLPAGTKLTATVTKPGNFIGAVKIMTVKKKARPSFVDRCIAPGTTRAVGC